MNSLSLFCVFWLSFGMIQLPSLGIAASYSPTGNAAEGAASPDYNNAIGLYLIVWGFAFVTYFIFSLKTNAIFAGIFGFAAIAVTRMREMHGCPPCCCRDRSGLAKLWNQYMLGGSNK